MAIAYTSPIPQLDTLNDVDTTWADGFRFFNIADQKTYGMFQGVAVADSATLPVNKIGYFTPEGAAFDPQVLIKNFRLLLKDHSIKLGIPPGLENESVIALNTGG